MTGIVAVSPAVACVASVVVLLVGEVRGMPGVRVVAKPLASGAFLLSAVVLGALRGGPAGEAVFVGLCLAAVGDVALLGRSRPAFLGGLAAFLLGHVGYAVGFVLLGVAWPAVAVAGGGLGGVAFAVWRWLAPHVGALRGPVAAYVVVITGMLASSVGAAVAEPTGPRIGLAASALAFFCSDLAVARERFVASGPNDRLWGLPLYYGAQLGFGAWIGAA